MMDPYNKTVLNCSIMENTKKIRKELFEFAYTQEKFGIIIEHQILTHDALAIWRRTQYDAFVKNNNGYDNTSNMTIEENYKNDSIKITSELMYTSLTHNKNLTIDPYTAFKYYLHKTKDIEKAWSMSNLSSLSYEKAIWILELFTGETENIIDIYKNILDDLNIKYVHEKNILRILDNYDNKWKEYLSELFDLTDDKIEQISRICLEYAKLF